MNKEFKQVIILADDFTGACDTAVRFRQPGYYPLVLTPDAASLDSGSLSKNPVLALDLESRHDTSTEAYEKYFRMGNSLKDRDDILLYKKIDSTFRGNIGAEIDGLLDGLESRLLLLAPALPAQGRTISEGIVYVHGTRLNLSDIAKDPASPVLHAGIADIIGLQSRRKTALIGLEAIRENVQATVQRVIEQIRAGAEIILFDGENEDDLLRAAEIIMSLHHPRTIIAGTLGLAGCLVSAFKPAAHKINIAFCGSMNPATRSQVKHAAAHASAVVLELSTSTLLEFKQDVSPLLEEFVKQLSEGKMNFILTVMPPDKDTAMAAPARVAAALGSVAASVILLLAPAGVLLTGGDTAVHTVRFLGAQGISLEEELLPGIQSGTLVGSSVRSKIITKAGGFGAEDSITKALGYFNNLVCNQ